VVLSWQADLEEQVRERRACREVRGPAGPLAVVSDELGFARLPIGAPVTAIVVEELAALGGGGGGERGHRRGDRQWAGAG